MQKVVRTILKKRKIVSDKIAAQKLPGKSNRRSTSVLQQALATALIAMVFGAGRPFHLGDKLEVVAVKR